VSVSTITANRTTETAWPRVRLGDVCRVVGGSTPKTGIDGYWNGNIVWVTPSDLGRLESDRIGTSDRLITQSGYDSCGAEMVPPGSVVMSSRAPIGHLAIAAVPLCTNQGCKTFVPGQGVDSEFLFYRLRQAVPDLQALGSGATFVEVSKRQCEAFEISLPPLPEQKRIAAALREQLEAAARMGAAAALELEDVNRLERAELRRLFDSREAENWPQCDLRDICVKITDGTHQPPPFTEDGIPFLFVRNIVSGTIDFDTEKHVTQKTFETLTRSWRAERGDILYSAVGSFGVAVVVETDRRFAFQRHIALLKLQLDVVDPWFLSFYLNSPGGKAQSEARALGGGQRTVTLGSLGGFRVPRPPLDIQRGVAARLHSRLADVAETRARFESQAAEIGRLSAALLRRAFSGGL